jgi:pimeloyl-ACP methyl ester carboxylesterase
MTEKIILAQLAHVRTAVLDVGYEQSGAAGSLPVVLLHGYPYDVRAFDEVVPILNAAGLRTIVPYQRGYGATSFLSPDTIRSGEQAALGQDLLELLDALQIRQAVLAGFDWGGRAACVVSALWPERVRGLVSCTGYQIQHIASSDQPADPEQERRFWYQYYFQTERGRKASLKCVANLADCYGSYGRRPGRLMMRLIVGLPRLLKTLISSMLSFTLIGIGWVTLPATHAMLRQKPDWRLCQRLAFRPL